MSIRFYLFFHMKAWEFHPATSAVRIIPPAETHLFLLRTAGRPNLRADRQMELFLPLHHKHNRKADKRTSYISPFDLCLPKSMQIAVSISSFHFIPFTNHEAGFWLVARIQRLALVAALRLKGDPFNIMGIEHRMQCRPDCDRNNIILDFDNRNMFFG